MYFARLQSLVLAMACSCGAATPFATAPLHAQTATTNLEESKVRAFTLPSALALPSGKTVRNAKEWEAGQRAAILQRFAENVYGRMPGRPPGMRFVVDRTDPAVFDGLAVLKEISIVFGSAASAPAMHVLLYLPAHSKSPVPVVVSLNFMGNHSVSRDEQITIQQNWLAARTGSNGPPKRGIQESRWPLQDLLQRGYGVATAWYGDLEVDRPDGYRSGVRTTLADAIGVKPQEWGALGAWAWGMSRIVDYLETNTTVDSHRIIALGHSRLGKATLWAGANDRRFAMVVANDSGEGGAALARRDFGETIQDLNRAFPHWFVARYQTYNNHPERLPVDQHELLSLIAPRPLYIASATEDLWSDPKGEFLGAQATDAVYGLYGYPALPGTFPPHVDTSIGSRVGYHLRTGKHDITLFDWIAYIDFADRNLKR